MNVLMEEFMGSRAVLVFTDGVDDLKQKKLIGDALAAEGSKIVSYKIKSEFDSRVRNYRWATILGLGRFSKPGKIFIEEVTTKLDSDGVAQDVVAKATDVGDPSSVTAPTDGMSGTEAESDPTGSSSADTERQTESAQVFYFMQDNKPTYKVAQTQAAGEEGVFEGDFNP